MDIFESLENLPVSESCFEDIISIVEEYINEIYNQVVKRHGKPEYDESTGKPLNKAATLLNKFGQIQKKDEENEIEKEKGRKGGKTSSTFNYTYGENPPFTPEAGRVYDRRMLTKQDKNDSNYHTSASLNDQGERAFVNGKEFNKDTPEREQLNTGRGMVKHAKNLEKRGENSEKIVDYYTKGYTKKIAPLQNKLEQSKQEQKESQKYREERNKNTKWDPEYDDAPDIENAADDSYEDGLYSQEQGILQDAIRHAKKGSSRIYQTLKRREAAKQEK